MKSFVFLDCCPDLLLYGAPVQASDSLYENSLHTDERRCETIPAASNNPDSQA
jgi:hypothetical protein